MKHRIFIAINLPEDIKKFFTAYQAKWSELPAKWTEENNLHITALFIGDADDEKIPEIKEAVAKVASDHGKFSIHLEKISYGPPGMIPPRMVWAIGVPSKEFSALEKDAAKKVKDIFPITVEERESILHITLSRVREWEWRRYEPDERPEIEEFIDLNFEVKSIELMESTLKRSGPEYTVLQTYKLH